MSSNLGASPPPPIGGGGEGGGKDRLRGGLGPGNQGTEGADRMRRLRSGLFSESLLVVSQKYEVVNSIPLYAIFDQNGARIGSVADVRARDNPFRPDRLAASLSAAPVDNPASGVMGALNALRAVAREHPYELEVWNEAGVAVLVLTSAGGFVEERTHITVRRGDGATIGTITLQDSGLLRKRRYALEAGGQRVGTIVVNWSKGPDHHVLDAHAREVAQIAQQPRGSLARALAREPKSFTVKIALPLPEPLHSLLLAGALTADTALNRWEPEQGSSG